MICIQLALGLVATPSMALIYVLYLTWAGLLIVLGRNLRESLGHHVFVDGVACGFLFGALIGACLSLMPQVGEGGGASIFYLASNGGATGNVGQRNHHVHHLWLGIASTLYLLDRKFLSRYWAWLVIALLCLGSVIAGSRSVFLYAAFLTLLAVYARRHRKLEGQKLLARDALLLLPAVLVANALIGLLSVIAQSNIGSGAVPAMNGASSASRLYTSLAESSDRWLIARTAWAAFVDTPWLGHGPGGYPWASFVASSFLAGRGVVAEHAHNVVLQSLVEFGVGITVVVLVLVFMWGRRFVHEIPHDVGGWYASILGIGGLHALLEYPYWYTYFLGATALLVGASDAGICISRAVKRLRGYVVIVGVAGSLVLAFLRIDYAAIETILTYPRGVHGDQNRAWQASMSKLAALYQNSLLSPWALLVLVNVAEPSQRAARDKAELCNEGIRYMPARELVLRCAIQSTIAGFGDTGEGLLGMILRAYPQDEGRTIDEWSAAELVFPQVAALHLSEKLRK